jgi:hypothetical protein
MTTLSQRSLAYYARDENAPKTVRYQPINCLLNSLSKNLSPYKRTRSPTQDIELTVNKGAKLIFTPLDFASVNKILMDMNKPRQHHRRL